MSTCYIRHHKSHVNSCQTQTGHDTVISDTTKVMSTLVKHRQHMILLYQTPQKSCQLLSNTDRTWILLYQTPQSHVNSCQTQAAHDTVISDTTKVNSCQTQTGHDTVISDTTKVMSTLVKHRQHMILLYQTPQKSSLVKHRQDMMSTLVCYIRHHKSHQTPQKSTLVKHRQDMILLYQTPQKSCQLLSKTGST